MAYEVRAPLLEIEKATGETARFFEATAHI